MSTFQLLAGLPLEVDGYTLEGLRADVSSGFERLTGRYTVGEFCELV